MGRSAVHTSDSLLDHAIGLVADGGPAAVSMSAVARAAGAPSGSVYHRFADRPTLLAALWLRTTERFEDAFLATLGAPPSPTSAVAAAAWTVEWCRERPGEAAVLHAGFRALAPDGWSDELAARIEEREARRRRAIVSSVRAVAEASSRPADEVSFAMFELPLAVLHSYLGARTPVPPEAVDRVRRIAARLLLS